MFPNKHDFPYCRGVVCFIAYLLTLEDQPTYDIVHNWLQTLTCNSYREKNPLVNAGNYVTMPLNYLEDRNTLKKETIKEKTILLNFLCEKVNLLVYLL